MFHYEYQPMSGSDSIRLINLSPGLWEEPLRGTVIHKDRSTAGPYIALSYTWGSDQKSAVLMTPEGQISITQSLHDALRRLRAMNNTPVPEPNEPSITEGLFSALKRMQSNENPLVIWADAICINQADNKEKSLLVGRMNEIYKDARYVAVYLGEEADDSNKGIELLAKLSTAKPGPSDFGGGLPSPLSEEWASMRALLDRPWFRRVWVVQEFVVGAEVAMICGEMVTGWEIYFQALMTARIFNIFWQDSDYRGSDRLEKQARLSAYNTIIGMGRHRARCLGYSLKNLQSRLLDLLMLFSDAKATDPRDHLFALLGFSSDSDDEAFTPNYEVNLGEVVRTYAATFVERGEALKLLCDAGLGSQAPELPSWIPSWTTEKPLFKPESLALLRPSQVNRSPYRASDSIPPRIQYDATADFLVLRGGFVDQITQVSHSDDKMDLLGRLTTYVVDAEEMIGKLSSYPTGEDPQQVKWKALIANRVKKMQNVQQVGTVWDGEFSKPPPEFRRAYDALKLFTMVMKANAAERYANEMALIKATSEPYIQPLIDARTFRLMCKTEGGYVGLVSQHSLPGDLVCIIYGSPVPFTLRKSDEREGAYRLVGECFIHGLMEGEALESDKFEETYMHLH